jgi:molecular chaperone GrpE
MPKKKTAPKEDTPPENGHDPTPTGEEAAPTGEDTRTPALSDALVGLTPEEYDQLLQVLETARAEAKTNLDNFQRALADYQNLKRRVEIERNEMYQNAVGSVVKGFLEIGDDLERALKNRPNTDPGKAWADGIDLVYRKIMRKLDAQGVKPIEAEGQIFDPHIHEAIGQVEDDRFESGQIVEVLAPGYMIGERVIRPAVVRVAA